MSLVTRKPVFGVSNQVRLKPAWSSTETSSSLEILAIASTGIILSRQRTIMALIRLRAWGNFILTKGNCPLNVSVASVQPYKRKTPTTSFGNEHVAHNTRLIYIRYTCLNGLGIGFK